MVGKQRKTNKEVNIKVKKEQNIGKNMCYEITFDEIGNQSI